MKLTTPLLFSALCFFFSSAFLWQGCSYKLRQDISGENQLSLKNASGAVIVNYTDKKVRNPDEDIVYHWTRLRELHSSQGGYSGKLLHGEFRSYFPDGELREKGNFKKGMKTGDWRKWDYKGNLKSSERYRRGKLRGKSTYYGTNDTIKIIKYKNSVKHGKTSIYVNGEEVETLKYKRGIVQENPSEEHEEEEDESKEGDEGEESIEE